MRSLRSTITHSQHGIGTMSDKQPCQAAGARAPGVPMSAVVADDNPYSRLMALQAMGIVAEYDRIRGKAVAIVGVGGVGSVAADMLTRCGVGRLLLFDHDTVTAANMNRLFFTPAQAGQSKVAAAVATLGEINPDVTVEGHAYNVASVAHYDAFVRAIAGLDAPAQSPGLAGSSSGSDGSAATRRVDLALSCVDNYAARLAVNRACLALDLPWMESGVSEDAVSGHIQFLLPGATACYECVPPLAVASGIDESTIRRPGVCAASLPTVMAIIAGLLAQNALKHLLGFGQVAYYQGFASLGNAMTTELLRPNPACASAECVRRQAEVAARGGWTPQVWRAPLHDALVPVVHETNEWGIAVGGGGDGGGEVGGSGGANEAGIGESGGGSGGGSRDNAGAVITAVHTETPAPMTESTAVGSALSLAQLRAQLRAVQGGQARP
jgi:ubiquitin-like modifier-activating enzyme 5